MKKYLKIPILILIFVLIAGGLFWRKQSEKTIYNTSYVNGNTAGNLYNAGLFCENNGVVFFANPDDNYRLYSMDAGGGDLKKICDDTVSYINADSHYIYYVRDNDRVNMENGFFSFHNNSLCRIDRDGKNVKVLDKDPCIYASLIGNYIYYLHYDKEQATTLYKIGIDGEDRKQIYDTYQFTCSTSGQYFYFNNMKTDGSIWRYDTASDSASMIYNCNSYKPIVLGSSNAYYLDVNRNNALVHTNLDSQKPTVLSNKSIDLYNVYGSTIYYQTYDDEGSALYMIKSDGTGERRLALGTFKCINVTSYYIYFTDYFTGQVYRTPTSNPGDLTLFHPGKAE